MMLSIKHASVLKSMVLAALVISLMNSGCGSDEGQVMSTIPYLVPCDTLSTTPYTFDIAAHFPPFATPVHNQTTEEGVALGRRLYYDKMLSEGGPFEGKACASCHFQISSFTKNTQGTAVLPHTNLNWASYFLWNGKISGGLEEVMNFEIVEFFQADIALFKADPTYQRLSCEAFGTNDISEREMADAMAQWMRTLVSSRSKYDRYLAGEEALTELESMGEIIFTTSIGDCFKCHALPLTTDLAFHNNGLESSPTGYDMGRFNVTGDPADIGWFKTPTLRNVALTAPYMHDGRFQTLEEVVEHYNSTVRWSTTLDPVMQTGDKKYGLGLSQINKDALVAFLKTFTDTSFTNDPEFSDPFKQ
jgi:cytochrome c peroxidase